jgi:ATP-binding cassette subfamily F protein uup
MAAPLLTLEELGLLQGGRWLLRGLDLAVGERDRLALIGRNGAGKTTLFRLLTGAIEPDEGRRSVRPAARIVLVEQDPDMAGHATLADWALAGADAPPRHGLESVAGQLGADLARPAATASGGERRRAAIARALAQEPDLLLLDEPTNHLDIAAIEWLEAWLARFRGAFIAISHDRAFLARLTRTCLWLDRGRLRRAEVGFGGFEAWVEQVREEEARAAEKLDAKLAQELRWLARGVTARRRRNQGRLERLEQMRAQRRAMLGEAGAPRLALAEAEAKSKTVIEAERVSVRFPDPAGGDERCIIRDFSIRIQRGDRIGIVGPNGAGKTTLLRVLTGELEPSEGQVRIARTVEGVAIDQQRRLLDPARRVRDVLAEAGDWIEVRGARKHIIGYLKEYLFGPEIADAPIGSLSGGERARVLLAREFARQANLLVLDEPTNDLDLETLDLLQEVVAEYEGTVLIVSHDRDFLDRTVTMVVGLDGSGRADVVAGGYADWERKRRRPGAGAGAGAGAWTGAGGPGRGGAGGGGGGRPGSAGAATGGKAGAGAAPAASAGAAAAGGAPPPARRKLSFRDQHDLEKLPAEIARLEAEVARLEAALADPGLYGRDPDGFARLTGALEAARARLGAAEERWLEVAALAEALG